MADKLIAFADESVRVNAASPMYLIAATIIPENMSLTRRGARSSKSSCPCLKAGE